MSTTTRNQRRRNKSICQKSTEIAMNITRLSSQYLTRFTPGPRLPAKSRQGHVEVPAKSRQAYVEVPVTMVEPTSSSELKPELKPEPGVDTRAAEFIYNFKRRNQQADPGVHKEISKCIPPPPTATVKWAKYQDY